MVDVLLGNFMVYSQLASNNMNTTPSDVLLFFSHLQLYTLVFTGVEVKLWNITSAFWLKYAKVLPFLDAIIIFLFSACIFSGVKYSRLLVLQL